MVEQVPGQVAVVGGERGSRGRRHRSDAGGHGGDRVTAAGRVGPDVLQQFLGSAETLAAQRRHGGRFGGGWRRGRRSGPVMVTACTAWYDPTARVRPRDGRVERRRHGRGGHQRRQVPPLMVALRATGRTTTGCGGGSHHRMVLGGERQCGGCGGMLLLLLLSATGGRATAHRILAVAGRHGYGRGRRMRWWFGGGGRGERHGGWHPRGTGQVRMPERSQGVGFVGRMGRQGQRWTERLGGRSAVHHLQAGPDYRVGGRVGGSGRYDSGFGRRRRR